MAIEVFDSIEILKLKTILKLIIPSGDTKMPEADLILDNLDFTDSNHAKFIDLSKELCEKLNLEQLKTEDSLNLFKKTNFRIFSIFVNSVLIIYYSNKLVLSKLKTGSNPPFPEGNFVKEGDIYLLEQVFLKDKMYKD